MSKKVCNKRKKESDVGDDKNKKMLGLCVSLSENLKNGKALDSGNTLVNMNLSTAVKLENTEWINSGSQNSTGSLDITIPHRKEKKENIEEVCNVELPRRTRAQAGKLERGSQKDHVLNTDILEPTFMINKHESLYKEKRSKKLHNISNNKNLLLTSVQTKKQANREIEEPSRVANFIEDSSSSKKINSKSKQNKKSISQKPIKQETKKSGVERSVVRKGQAAVDGLCPVASISHVYCEEEAIWDCMLNQTNIQFNNNKYYLIQLLKDDEKEIFSVWMRWGRVGCPGQNCLKPFGSNLEKAKDTFKKKFSDKTKNDWELRSCFEKVPGKYDLLMMDYSHDADTVDALKKEEKPIVSHKKTESKLEDRVKALVELICDVRAMEEAVMEMKYDANKAPLGKLTMAQVKAGYAALKRIDDLISEHGNPSNKILLEACNLFYTRIPHYFGMKVPPLIRTKSEIQEKLSLLQALGDIQAVMSILCQPIGEGIHPADQHYNGLGCDIEPLENNSDEYKMLEKYLKTTHGSTHSMYKTEVLEIFKVSRSVEQGNFKDYGNRMLLWHGSRITNWAGILSKGLRIAPPEAPSTGYMFGKGIYFADMSSKSANYCMASSLHDIGLLVLCDVSLGQWQTQINANYNAHKLPPKYHSVKALGKFAPDPKNQIITSENIIVPLGPCINTEVNNKKGYTLQYNEYIVYDVNQVKVKYLFKLKFNFN